MVHRDADLPADRKAALDALGLLSRKWHPTVLAVIGHRGPVGFNRLLEAIPEISGKVLSDSLDALAEANLVDRTVVSESPLRVEYDLTAAGIDLDAVFDEFAAWANRHFDPTAPTVLVADGDRRLTEMYSRWLDSHYSVVQAHSTVEAEALCHDGVDVVVVAESVSAGLDGSVRPESRCVVVVEERPDFEVLSLDCDAVVRKPLVRNRLFDVVDEQVSRCGESAKRREYGALAAKRSLLESVYPAEALASNDGYADLCARLAALEDELAE